MFVEIRLFVALFFVGWVNTRRDLVLALDSFLTLDYELRCIEVIRCFLLCFCGGNTRKYLVLTLDSSLKHIGAWLLDEELLC